MTLSAVIAPAVRRPTCKSPPSPAPLHDCGPLGKLTVAEIAQRAGATRNAIRLRLAKGVPGEELCAASLRGKTYPCGRHGDLTVAQMAKLAGCTREAIKNRIKQGRKGAALVAKKWTASSRVLKPSPPKRHLFVAAMQIADAFPDSVPSIKQIQAIRPMSNHHAAVWRQAIATARGAFLEREGVA